MKDTITEEFFMKNRQVLRYMSMWPSDFKNKTHLFRSLLVCFLTTCSIIILEILYLYCDLYEDDIDYIRTWGSLGYHLVVGVKMFHWVAVLPHTEKMIMQIQRKSFDFDNIYILPEAILHSHDHSLLTICTLQNCDYFEEIRNKLVEEKRKMYLNLKKNCTNFTVVNMYIVLILSIFCIVFLYVTSFVSFKIGNFQTTRELPFGAYRVLNMSVPLQYNIEALSQMFANTVSALAALGSDICFISIMIHLTTQVKIICEILENNNCHPKNKSAKQQFQICVDETSIIINTVQKLDWVINLLLLFQDLLCVIIICSLIYVIPKDTDPTKMIGNVLYLVVLSTESLLMGWFAQTLTDQIIALTDSMYAMNWHEADSNFRKDIVFALRRLQKPVYVTVGNFAPANLQIHFTIMKTAYSFYTLITA